MATLALVAGCGGTAGVRAASTPLAPGKGAVVGMIVFDGHYASGVVKVFRNDGEVAREEREAVQVHRGEDRSRVVFKPGNFKVFGNGGEVAREVVRRGDDRFRFVVKPGNYTIKPVLPTGGGFFPSKDPCAVDYTAYVRANRTTHVAFAAASVEELCKPDSY